MLFLFALTISAVNAKIPDFDEMTDEERQVTGLNKLTPEELQALKGWLTEEQKNIEREIRKREVGFETRRAGSERKTFKAHLEKMYDDTLGNTYFELDNGQLWKRVSSGSIFIKKDGRHLVTLEPSMFGSWMIRGDGNKAVKVKRIK